MFLETIEELDVDDFSPIKYAGEYTLFMITLNDLLQYAINSYAQISIPILFRFTLL